MSRKSSSCGCGARTVRRGARTPACRVHTRVNAWSPSRVCARPQIILPSLSQTRLHRVALDRSRNPDPLPLISYPVVIRLALPKLLPGALEQLVRFSRSHPFERFQQQTRRDQRKQQHMNVIRHDHPCSQMVVPQGLAPNERIDYDYCDCLLPEVQGTRIGAVKKPIHPSEGLTTRDFGRRRETRMRKVAVQMPGEEQPAVVGIDVREAALGRHALRSGIIVVKFSCSHECEHGTQECVRHKTECVRHGCR